MTANSAAAGQLGQDTRASAYNVTYCKRGHSHTERRLRQTRTIAPSRLLLSRRPRTSVTSGPKVQPAPRWEGHMPSSAVGSLHSTSAAIESGPAWRFCGCKTCVAATSAGAAVMSRPRPAGCATRSGKQLLHFKESGRSQSLSRVARDMRIPSCRLAKETATHACVSKPQQHPPQAPRPRAPPSSSGSSPPLDALRRSSL